MEKPRVRSLFKYCQFNTRSISSLVGGNIWYPSALAFNDPFDCSVIDLAHKFLTERDDARRKIIQRPKIPKSKDKLKIRLANILIDLHDGVLLKENARDYELLQAMSDVQKSLQSSFHDFGILCLSETPKNILMWSHYAQNHTGLCLEFERTPENKLGTEAKPVKYVHSRYNESDPGLIFEKHLGWKYEREWRVLENKANKLYPFPGKLLSVICGAKIPKENRALIQCLIDLINNSENHKIKIIDAKMSPLKYEILLQQRASKES